MKSIPFSEVREYYARQRPDGQWFSAQTMKFFKSRLPRVAYETPAGVLFVTSEQFESTPRRFTVRRQTVDGCIKTVGEFCSYGSRAAALAAIKDLAVAV